jgi:hypothetical protein
MKANEFNPAWTLTTALPVLIALEAHLAPVGYHVAVVGSVLVKGASQKDLDIIVMPHKSRGAGANELAPAQDAIEAFFSKRLHQCLSTPEKPRDCKVVFWLRDFEGRRIDFFFLS